MNQAKHLCESWQAFLQQIMVYVSTGHYYHHFYAHPDKRREKLAVIDKRIIERFETNISKDQCYRRKQKGLANYIYLRWDLMIVILKADGEDPLEERASQRFDYIYDKPLEIPVGEDLTMKLCKEEAIKAKDGRRGKQGFTYYLERQCYRNIKAALLEDVACRRDRALVYRFNALNGIPAYAGIIKHKKLLLRTVLHAARKHGLALNRGDFRINTKLRKYKMNQP